MTVALLPNDPNDLELRRLVRPPGWINPKPQGRYQLLVLGGGPAGLVCAAAAAGLGARVALVERDLLGGDCLNVGCVPSKTLLRAARAAAEVHEAARFGVQAAGPTIDFPRVMERVRQVRAELARTDSAERFRLLGVDVFLGEGVFVNRETVAVDGVKLEFGRCVIATGTRPLIPDAQGLAESRCFTNESIFTLTELPRRLLVLGAGPVGCELAQAFARLGSTVTVYSRDDRVLPREEPEAAVRVKRALIEDGVTFASEPQSPSAFDAVLIATGRQPNVERLNLPGAEVGFDSHSGIKVDDFLCTSNRRIFAAGDVTTLGYRFTHAADALARLAVRNALFPSRARASALTIPWCTYTQPELGRIGLSEEEARDRNLEVSVFRNEAQLDRAVAEGAEQDVTVLVRKGTDRIVGVTVVGPHAGEVIGTFAVAMTHGIGLKQLANTVFPYPTYTEAVKKIGDQYNRSRLTPRAKHLLGTWLRWFR